MAKVEPLPLHEDLEALDGSVVRVQQELGEGEKLWRSVPAVTAVNYHWTSLGLEKVEVSGNLISPITEQCLMTQSGTLRKEID